MGLAALTRSSILYFFPLVLYWLWRNPDRANKERIKAAAVYFIFMALAVLPWSYRNYTVLHSPVLIDTSAGINLIMGNDVNTAMLNKDNLYIPYCFEQFHSFKDDGRRDRSTLLQGLDKIVKMPGRFLVKFVLQNFYLWTPDSLILRHLRNGWYGKTSLLRIRIILLFVVGFYFLVVLTALGGLILAPPGRLKGLTLLLIGYYSFVHGVMFALSRHRLPLMPFLIIFSSYFIMELIKRRGVPREKGFRRKWAAAVLVWTTTLPVIYDTWKTGGKGYLFQTLDIREKKSGTSSECLSCKSSPRYDK